MPFSRLNVMDYYNFNMVNFDATYPIQNIYRYDTQWHSNIKWWWSFQDLLTNSYIVYVKFQNMNYRKAMLLHYEFIRKMTLT